MKAAHVLGLNARNHLYSARYNTTRGKEIADSKLATKTLLTQRQLPHPRLLAHFKDPDDVPAWDWGSLRKNFVIKPTAGYAGDGIVLVRKRLARDRFRLMDNTTMSLDELKYHVLDILEGQYSRYDFPGEAMIEERVLKHPRFRRYAFRGTPDVRVVVFNNVPVMAMLRLPTRESRGRANLHQGAIGVGIDLATGITTHAIQWDRPINTVPGKKWKLNGIRLPWWDRILELAVEIPQYVPLGFLAVDFLLDPDAGPVIVELTSKPGLSIQLANMRGLKRRLERIEGLRIAKGKGIQVARALFAESFADRVLAEKGAKVVNVFETVRVRGADRKRHEFPAKLDTGAFRSSIDRELAQRLGLLAEDNVLWRKYYVSTLGRERRPIIGLTFWLQGRKIQTSANISNRSRFRQKLLVGRRDLGSFMVKAGG